MTFSKPATDYQINRLRYEGLACAIKLANLRTAICTGPDGLKYIGDNIRPHLSDWFERCLLPVTLKTHFVLTWINPKAEEILISKGFKGHGFTDELMNNITDKEADCLIKEFTKIKESLQRDKEVINGTNRKLSELKNRKHHGHKKVI